MKEYKIISGNKKEVQTTLNQWRHIYKIDIHSFVPIVLSNLPYIYYHMLVEIEKLEETK